MVTRTLGILATVVSCVQMVPQLYKTYTTQRVEDISLYSLVLICIANIFWGLHGYIIGDAPLIVAGALTAAINGTLLFLYFKYSKR
jgi:uncharacterized protein with PQ loop repeat